MRRLTLHGYIDPTTTLSSGKNQDIYLADEVDQRIAELEAENTLIALGATKHRERIAELESTRVPDELLEIISDIIPLGDSWEEEDEAVAKCKAILKARKEADDAI